MEEQLTAYRQWLVEQADKDRICDREGIPPVPRSHHERLAIYYALPKGERLRFLRIGGRKR